VTSLATSPHLLSLALLLLVPLVHTTDPLVLVAR